MKKSLLLITSLPSIQQSLTEALKKDFYIHIFASGTEAIEWLEKENAPDVILADSKMTGINCADFIEAIRLSTIFRQTPVLLFSSGKNEFKYLEYGIDDYISDPYNLLEVHIRVRNACRKSLKTNACHLQKINSHAGSC